MQLKGLAFKQRKHMFTKCSAKWLRLGANASQLVCVAFFQKLHLQLYK